MLTPDLIGADAEITEALLLRDGAIKALADEMSKHIVNEASERGIVVFPEDVFVWRTGGNDTTHIVRYSAVWAPDPSTNGIEFFGGSHDGEVFTGCVRAEGPGGAFPPGVLNVMGQPVTEDFSEVRRAERPPELVAIQETYVRVGIDSTKRRFIYKIKVQ